MSVNKVFLIGNLGGDVVFFENEKITKATFRLATHHKHKDSNGQKCVKTEWHNIVILGKLAEIARKYLCKGKQIFLEGHIETRVYEDKGENRYITEIYAKDFTMLGKSENKNVESDVNNSDAETVDEFE